MSDKNYLLTISTAVIEPEKFIIDGEEYHFLGLNHLGEEEEAEVFALFAQYTRLSNELSFAPKVAVGKKIAQRMREIRVKILAILTDISEDQLKSYPVGVHTQLMDMAEKVLSGTDEEEETDPEDDEL